MKHRNDPAGTARAGGLTGVSFPESNSGMRKQRACAKPFSGSASPILRLLEEGLVQDPAVRCSNYWGTFAPGKNLKNDMFLGSREHLLLVSRRLL